MSRWHPHGQKTRHARAAGAAGGSTRCRDDRAILCCAGCSPYRPFWPPPASKARSAVSSTPKSGWNRSRSARPDRHASLLRRCLQRDLRVQRRIDHWPRTRGELASYRCELPADSPLITNGDRPPCSVFAFCHGASVPARRCSRRKVSMPGSTRQDRTVGSASRTTTATFAFADDPIRGVEGAESPVATDAAGNGSRKREKGANIAWPQSLGLIVPAGISGSIMLLPSKLLL
jgi:hypothetical protein